MAAMKKWVPRLVLALAVGVALPLLPALLTQSVGPGADLSGKLGLAAGVSAGTFVVLFVGAVLTSRTPCVYPLIPITVGIFGARQAEHRSRSVALSATYVGGIAAMYSVLGLFAALSGEGFGMGLAAGIIAAPCTGPVLAGVLAYVATQRNAVLGFWMLFTYAIGMGLLFFVLGATSLRLPRSGAWMETVKSVLGVALLAAAVSLVLPFIPRAGPLPLSARAVGVATGVLAFVGVALGALSLSFHGDRREKAMKLVALGLLVAGRGLRFGWAGGR